MKDKEKGSAAEKAESPNVAKAAQPASHLAQHDSAQPSKPSPRSKAKQLLPRSPTPTMKTESVDTDSASKSATPSPAPSPASPPVHVGALPPEPEVYMKPNELQVGLKILVSNSASGLIIGRSGNTISALQARSATRIKLSQGGDYYPGTSDRVCLVQGSMTNVCVAVELVLAKLYELQSFQQLATAPQTNPVDGLPVPDENTATSFIVRILVPSTACGMIIGRGGSNIKSLKEKSEVTYLQLSPKEHEVMVGGCTMSTSERIMTITGPNFASCVTCVRCIVNDMAQNPDISRYINMTTSYSRNMNMVAAPPGAYTVANAPGFFLDHEQFQVGRVLETPPRYSHPEQFVPGQFTSSPPRSGVQATPERNTGLLSPHQLMQNQGPPSNYELVAQGIMPQQMLGEPYAVQSAQRIADPAIPPSSSFPQYQPPQGSQQFWPPDHSSGSPGRILPAMPDQLSQDFQNQASLQSHPSHSSLQQLAGPQPVTGQLHVPDALIGSILGRGGKKLNEIQAISHTKIRISQRGEYYPGTQNRIVYITGDTTQHVDHARHLLDRHLYGLSNTSPSSELQGG